MNPSGGAGSRIGRARRWRLWSVLLAGAIASFAGCANQGDPFGKNPFPVVPIGNVVPGDGATGVSINTHVTIAFTLDLDFRTATRNNLFITDDHRRVVGARVLYDAPTRTVTIVPLEPLREASTYLVVAQDVRTTDDVTFNTLVARFATGLDPNGRPSVLTVIPRDGQTEVGNLTPIGIQFSRIMDRASLLGAFSVSPSTPGTATFLETTGNTSFTFTPGQPYPAGEPIVITVRSDARDTRARTLERTFLARFVTEQPPAVRLDADSPFPPQPPSGSRLALAGASVNTTVSVRFTRVMDEESVRDGMNLLFGSTVLGRANGTYTFTVETTNALGQPVPPHSRVVYRPTNPLPASTLIDIRVDGRARSLASASSTGQGLDPIFFSSFQTAP